MDSENNRIEIPQSLRDTWRATRGDDVLDKGAVVSKENLCPISSAIAHAGEQVEINAEIGDLVVNQGIYLGKWQPVDREGNSLGKTFNVFAAPENLKGSLGQDRLRTYEETFEKIKRLSKWHGHNGAGYESDSELLQALKEGTYKGEWVIPPRELVSGKNCKDEEMQADNLYRHQKTGKFNGTFPLEADDRSGIQDMNFYWSCTVLEVGAHTRWIFNLANQNEHYFTVNGFAFNCRPVRLVEVKP